MRRILLAVALLLVFAAAAQADGDPASDVLVFKKYFLPYAPQTPSDIEQKLNVATAAADRAGFPIRVAVISGPGDLGVVPQYTNKPQDYAKFLGDELKFAYKGPLLIVMQNGYGLSGTDGARPPAGARHAAEAEVERPGRSRRRRRRRRRGAGEGGAARRSTCRSRRPRTPRRRPPRTPRSASSDSSNTTAIVLIAGGTVGLLVALGGLFWWVRRAPEEEAA